MAFRSASTAESANGLNIDPGKPLGTTSADLLIAEIGITAQASSAPFTPTDPAWVLIQQTTIDGWYTAIFAAPGSVTSTEFTTATYSGFKVLGRISAFSGRSLSTPVRALSYMPSLAAFPTPPIQAPLGADILVLWDDEQATDPVLESSRCPDGLTQQPFFGGNGDPRSFVAIAAYAENVKAGTYQYSRNSNNVFNRRFSAAIAMAKGGTIDITEHPKNQALLVGQTATFHVAATGSGAVSYLWQYSLDGGNEFIDTIGFTSSTLEFSATSGFGTSFCVRCKISDSVSDTTSDIATLTYIPVNTTGLFLGKNRHGPKGRRPSILSRLTNGNTGAAVKSVANSLYLQIPAIAQAGLNLFEDSTEDTFVATATVGASGSGASGTLVVSEVSTDTFAASGVALVVASLAATETVIFDTFGSTAASLAQGQLVGTEAGADTFAASGVVQAISSGALAVSESGADTFAASGVALVAASLTVNETAIFDTFGSTAASLAQAQLASIEVGADTASISASALAQLVLSASEIPAAITLNSVKLNTTMWGNDFAEIASAPSNNVLLTAWTKNDAKAIPSSHNNKYPFEIRGSVWSVQCICGNGGSVDTSATGSVVNSNTSIFGGVSGSPGTYYFGDYSGFAVGGYPLEDIEGWQWNAWLINNDTTAQVVTISQWTVFQSNLTTPLFYQSVKTYAELRADATASGGWVDPSGWVPDAFTQIRVGSAFGNSSDPYNAIHFKVYSGVTSLPSTAALLAIANDTAPDTSAWADWRLNFTASADLSDSSGNGRSLSVHAGGTLYSGFVGPVSEPVIVVADTASISVSTLAQGALVAVEPSTTETSGTVAYRASVAAAGHIGDTGWLPSIPPETQPTDTMFMLFGADYANNTEQSYLVAPAGWTQIFAFQNPDFDIDGVNAYWAPGTVTATEFSIGPGSGGTVYGLQHILVLSGVDTTSTFEFAVNGLDHGAIPSTITVEGGAVFGFVSNGEGPFDNGTPPAGYTALPNAIADNSQRAFYKVGTTAGSTGELNYSNGAGYPSIQGAITIKPATVLAAAGDVFVGSGTVTPVAASGDLAATETGSDTAALSGVTLVAASLAATETAIFDTFGATALNLAQGQLAATEVGSDTASLAGFVLVAGTLASTEVGSDSLVGSGTVLAVATLTATETAIFDTFGSTAASLAQGQLVGTEAGADTFAASGVVLVTASLAATETDTDTFSANASLQAITSGTLAATETAIFDTFGLTAETLTQGQLDATETGADTFEAAAGTLAQGQLDATETGTDTFAATAVAIASITLVTTETVIFDTFGSTAATLAQGQLASTEVGADIFAATAVVYVVGSLAATETGADTFFAFGGAAGTASLAATETEQDTFSGAATVLVVASLAVTETVIFDTFGLTAETLAQGQLVVSEVGSDTAAIVAIATAQGDLAVSETGSDTFSGNASLQAVTSGTLAATETEADTFAASGVVYVVGSLAATETAIFDTFGLTAETLAQAQLAATEAGADVMSASGAALVSADLASTESGVDTFSASAVAPVAATLAATETVIFDTFGLTATVLAQGQLSVSDSGSDTFTASGVTLVVASLAATETVIFDTFGASAAARAQGQLAATETGSDTFAATTDTTSSGTLAVTEVGADTFAASGVALVVASLVATETVIFDTFGSTAASLAQGQLAATEVGADTFAATGEHRSSGTLTATETAIFDTFGSSALTLAQGALGAIEVGLDTAAMTGEALVMGMFAATETVIFDTFGSTAVLLSQGQLDAVEVGEDTFHAYESVIVIDPLGFTISVLTSVGWIQAPMRRWDGLMWKKPDVARWTGSTWETL